MTSTSQYILSVSSGALSVMNDEELVSKKGKCLCSGRKHILEGKRETGDVISN